jgi:hypothetical protein
VKLGVLEFKPEDFSRAELQRVFGDNADWFYLRLAEIANLELLERLARAPRLHGRLLGDHFYPTCVHSPIYEHETTHAARLVCVEPVGAAAAIDAGADRFELVAREIRAMSPETRRRLDELLCKLGETERAKDVTPKEGT